MARSSVERRVGHDVLDSLLDPLVILQPLRNDDGTVVDFVYAEANERACEQTRVEHAALIGKRLLELFPGHWQSGLLARYAGVVDTGQPVVLNDQPYANELFPGSVRFYDIRATAVADGVLLTWRDVTERHRAAEDLRQSRERFQLLAELSSDVVYFTDVDGVVQWVSPAVDQILGWRPDQLIGSFMDELLHQDDRTEAAVACVRGHDQKPPTGRIFLDLRARTAAGHYRWVRIDGRPVLDAEGRRVGWVCGWRDIDDLVRSRQEQEAAAVRGRVTMDALADPVLVLEPSDARGDEISDFALNDVNEAACRFLGRTREELMGSSVYREVAGLRAEVGAEVLAAVAAGAVSFSADDILLPGVSEGVTYVDVRAEAASGRVILTLRDATSRHESAAVVRANERRFRMLAESVSDVVLELDTEDVIVWASPSIESTMGIAASDAVGRTVTELIPASADDDRSFAHRAGETIAVVESGGTRTAWMATRVVPIVGDDGHVHGSVVGMTDVTETVQARSQADRARAETRRTQLSMAEAAIGMLRLTVDGVVAYANSKASHMMSRTVEDLVGVDVRELVQEDLEGFERAFARVRGRVSSSEQLRLALRDHGSTRIWVDAFLSPVREEDSSVSGVLLQVVDVSQEVVTHEALSVSREHFRMLAENSTDVVYETNAQGIIQWVSPSVESSLGWTPEDLLGRSALELIHPADHDDVIESRQAVYGRGQGRALPVRFRTSMGDYRWMAARATPIWHGDETVTGAVVGCRDVTGEMEALRRLETSERTFRAAMAEAPQGMALSDLQDRVTEVNPMLARILRTSPKELIGRRLGDFMTGPPNPAGTCAERLLASDESTISVHEHELATDGQERRWVQHSLSLIREKDGTPEYFVHQIADVTAFKAAEQQLRFQASHDLLTGLLNREGLMARLAEWLPEDESDPCLAVLFCDIDGLKGINDDHGHAAGDAALREVARRIKGQLRRGDIAGRISGDEFIVLLDRIQSIDEAEPVGEKVRAGVDGVFGFEGTDLALAVSVGVARANPGESPEELIERADEALYRAKNGGRNRVSC